MRKLLMRILCSAAHQMWRQEPDLGTFTGETFQHELNLQFHYANALRPWLPWLDCDFNVTKKHLRREQPDVLFHRRGINALNFLVFEIKRQVHRRDVPADLQQIRDRWFGKHLRYRFGAVVILEDNRAKFEVRILERGVRGALLTRTHANRSEIIIRPCTLFNELTAIVEQISEAERARNEPVIAPFLSQLDTLILNRYGVAPESTPNINGP